MEKIDLIDLRILDQLQQDSSLPMAELAERVGLSTSPCWRRVRRLQESGVITVQAARLDRQKLGLGFVVYAFIKLSTTTKETLTRFETIIRRLAGGGAVRVHDRCRRLSDQGRDHRCSGL